MAVNQRSVCGVLCVCVATATGSTLFALVFVAEAAEVQRRLGMFDAGPDPPIL